MSDKVPRADSVRQSNWVMFSSHLTLECTCCVPELVVGSGLHSDKECTQTHLLHD